MAELGETYLALSDLQRHSSPSYDHDRHVRRILSEVDTFITQYHLDHLRDVLRKGALLADDPADLERVDGLTLEERALLQDEAPTFNNSTLPTYAGPVVIPKLKLGKSILFAYIHGFLFGWEFFSLSFPFTTWRKGVSLDLRFHSYIAVSYIVAVLVGSCWAPVVNHNRGRRGAMLAGSTAKAIAMVLAAMFIAFPAFPGRFWAIRLLNFVAGVGDGVVTCTIPIYLSEIRLSNSPSYTPCVWPLAISAGYMLGVLDNIREHDLWVWLTYLEPFRIVVTLLVPVSLLIVNESPRWYVAHGYMDQAYRCLRELENADIRAARGLCQICSRVGQQRSASGLGTSLWRFAELFATPRLRRITLAAFTVMVSGVLGTSAMVCSYFLLAYRSGPTMISSIVTFPTFAFTLLQAIAASTFGTIRKRHRYLQTLSLLSLLLLLLPIGVSSSPSVLGKVLLTLLAYIVGAASVNGPGFIPFPYVAEIFPAQYRDVGMALSMCVYLGSQILIVRMGLLYLHNSLHVDIFLLFSITAAVCFVLVFLFMREPKHTLLEDIPLVFDAPMRMSDLSTNITQFLNGFSQFFRRSHVRLPSAEDQVDTRTVEPYTDDDATSMSS